MSEATDSLDEQAGDAVQGNEFSRLAILRTTGAIALLTVMAALGGGAALLESPTFDEIAHIGAGLSYADKLDTRFNPEHPPLEKLLSGIFMRLGSVRADYGSPQWTVGANFPASFLCEWSFGDWVLFHWNDPHKVLFWARLPMLLITLVLGWTTYWMGMPAGRAVGWVPLFKHLYHDANVLDVWSVSADGYSDRAVRVVDRLELCEFMARSLAGTDLEICILRGRRYADKVFRTVSPAGKPDCSSEYALGTVAGLDRRAQGARRKEGLAAAALVRYLERHCNRSGLDLPV